MTALMNLLRNRALPALTEWFLLLPVWFTLAILVFRDSGPGPVVITMAAVVALGAIMQRIVPLRKVWQYGVVCLLAAAAAYMLWPGPILEQLGAGVLVGACTARALLYGSRDWHALLHPNLGWVSLLLYFIAYFFYQHTVMLMPYRGVFAGCGVAALAVVLVLSNTAHVRASALTQDREDAAAVRPILRTNRMYLLALFALILGLSLYDTIWHFLTTTLREWLSRLLPKPGNNPDQVRDDTPQTMPDMGLPLEEGEPSRLAKILEFVFQWLVYAFLLVLAVVGLVYAVRGLRLLYRRLLRLLGRTVERSDDTGYIDEKESLIGRVMKDNRERWDRLWSRWTEREPKWEELGDNRERARFLFRSWLRRTREAGFAWRSPLTPEEIFREAERFAEGNGGSGRSAGRTALGSGRHDRTADRAERNGRDGGMAGPRAGDSGLSRETSLRAYHKARYGPPDTEPTEAEIARMREELSE